MLELLHRDGLARICKFTIGTTEVETPTLMPVINPNRIVISPRDIYDKFHLGAIITNSYIIFNDPILKQKALDLQLHNILEYPGIIMTDSGTFQEHVYGNLHIDPLDILEFQKKIGADIVTILDVFTEPGYTRTETAWAIEETLRRGAEAVQHRDDKYLAGPIQGSVYLDLRAYAAKSMNALEFDYYPIGGVVPLLEAYRYSDIVEIILASKLNIDLSKPIHLFGAGHPMFFAIAVLLGVDFFDSSSYIKYARAERLLFPDGTRDLNSLKYAPYYSPVLDKYDIVELQEMDVNERIKLIAEHNLFVSVEELNRIKAAIFEQSMWEYVEERSRSHPALYSALKMLKKYQSKLEQFENLSKKHAFYYTGVESLNRPIVYRMQKRIKSNFRRVRKSVVLVSEKLLNQAQQYINVLDATVLVHKGFGFVPYPLLGVYPVRQSVFPEKYEKLDNLKELVNLWNFEYIISWLDSIPHNIEMLEKFKCTPRDPDLERIWAIADYQFGPDAGAVLFNGKVSIVKSKNTGMIRNVFLGDKHILSMRNDGLFTLKYEGGKILHAHFSYPKLRVIVTDDSAEFNKVGKNVMARFIIDMDKNLVPGDEVLIVDKNDDYIGVGRTIMTRDEALHFKRGMVVKVREVR